MSQIIAYVLKCLPVVKAAAAVAVVTAGAATVGTYAFRGEDGRWRNQDGSLQRAEAPRPARRSGIRQDGPRCYMVPVYGGERYGLPEGPYVPPYDLATLGDYRLGGALGGTAGGGYLTGGIGSDFIGDGPVLAGVGIPGLPPMVPVEPSRPPIVVPPGPGTIPPIVPPVVTPVPPVPVPEPSTLALFIGSLAVLSVVRSIKANK